jgi:small subunit ribosomal protein S4e
LIEGDLKPRKGKDDMGKKGPSRHLKREMSPVSWPIHRKEKVWTIRTSSGSHSLDNSIPLLIIIRDSLGYAHNEREARFIINEKKILVDGKTVKNEKFPIGLMDVVEIPEANQIYRLLPRRKGKFVLHGIGKEESEFKLCKITGKTVVKGGNIQINLHDGRNVLLQDNIEDFKVNDVIKLKIPEQEVLDHIVFKVGVQVIITGGRSQGKYGSLMNIGDEATKNRTVDIKTSNGEEVRTLEKYVFSIGSENSLISLPGESKLE